MEFKRRNGLSTLLLHFLFFFHAASFLSCEWTFRLYSISEMNVYTFAMWFFFFNWSRQKQIDFSERASLFWHFIVSILLFTLKCSTNWRNSRNGLVYFELAAISGKTETMPDILIVKRQPSNLKINTLNLRSARAKLYATRQINILWF